MIDTPHHLGIRGKLSFCPVNPPRPCGTYVYQRVRSGLGNVEGVAGDNLQLRAHVIPYDPKTAAQLARRALMAAAVALWHTFTPDEKKAWRAAGKARSLPGFNAWVSHYLRSN